MEEIELRVTKDEHFALCCCSVASSAKHGRNFLCYCFAETAELRLLGLPEVLKSQGNLSILRQSSPTWGSRMEF
jgi:hypothetical protein